MSEGMKGISQILPALGPPVQILPQQQAPHRSSASTSCPTIRSSQIQPCRRVRLHSSHSISIRLQRVLLLDYKLQNGRFSVKHLPSSFHGEGKELEQQGPCPKETSKDPFNLYSTREPKTSVELKCFSRLFYESHRSRRNFPFLVTQLPSALEPQFCSASVDQRKTQDLNARGNLDQSTLTVKVVQHGSKESSTPVPTATTTSEQRRSWRAEKSSSDERAPSPSNGRAGPRFDTSYTLRKSRLPGSLSNSNPNSSKEFEVDMLGKRPLPSRSREFASTNSNPHSNSRTEAGVDCKNVIANQRVWRSPDGGADLTAQERFQSCASNGSRQSSRLTAPGNGSMHMRSAGTTSEAIVILQNRLQCGITAHWSMYIKVLQMCIQQKDLLSVKQVHDCIIQSGMDNNPYVANCLLNVYIKCGGLLDARKVFDELDNKSVIAWTMMIAGHANSDDRESALELFKLMCQEGVRPNEITYLCVLKACANPLALEWGKEVHEFIRLAGFESDVRVGTALVQMYAKCGSITEARSVFDRLTSRNSITWNIMVGAYAECGRGMEAYGLFLQMRREGFEPDVVTYLSILNASASAGALEWVKDIHGHASKVGLDSDLRVGNALIHMYAKSGSIDDAQRVFDRMEKRDVVSWNAMIGGLAQHGYGHEALALFREMNSDHVKPDETSFAAVLSACCHAGLLDSGRQIFSAITQDYGIEPNIVHYTCIVDLLGRAGHLEEAKRFISEMRVKPDDVIWKALLGACRTYGNVELGELAAKELFKLEPNDASSYVLLSNIYAAAGNWEKVSLVRATMQERGVRKEAGRSWIEVDSKIHEFVVGDTSHPEAKAIYAQLNGLTEKLKDEGYIPDTRLVLHDINEEDKELALCSHSEKLAITYGLMHVPRGEPIRVYKNLRVCSDCHTATKFISKVTGREIIARDAIRFHHFIDGVCSCRDYW